MGKVDKELKNYLDNNKYFADLFNGALYGGMEIITAQELEDYKTVSTLVDGNFRIEKTCDLAKKQKYMVWLLENQEHIDYDMPFRVMLKETIEYYNQIKHIQRFVKELFGKTNGERKRVGEYLYKFRKQDKIIPIVTLVVYWGKEPWDGARCLHDMIDFEIYGDKKEIIKNSVADYSIHLLDLSSEKDYSGFHTELQAVFELYSRRNSKKDFYDYYESLGENKLSYESIRVIGELTNSSRLLEKMNRGDENKEDVEMCLAIEEMYQDGVRDGREEGIKEGTSIGENEYIKNFSKKEN